MIVMTTPFVDRISSSTGNPIALKRLSFSWQAGYGMAPKHLSFSCQAGHGMALHARALLVITLDTTQIIQHSSSDK
jgi:hypothetical protein